MLYGKNDKKMDSYSAPIFGVEDDELIFPKDKLNQEPIPPRATYRYIMDELLDEGNARQNLATFCTTYMEPEAKEIMANTLEKNAIDKSEYPRTAEIEQRCVNIIADLWNAPTDNFIGTSTVGSSEACMLGGLALYKKWQDRANANQMPLEKRKPNLVISSGYQVCWEKFCVYWDIEMRLVPMDEKHMSLNLENITDYFDDNTIGVVGLLGITYTGLLDDIEKLDAICSEYNKTHQEYPVKIHVDGASGGFFIPFTNPDTKWDFQLENVVSINASGHKYGMVYPGIGWVLWKDTNDIPERLIFKVSYLGGEMPTMAINFSRSASQIIGQYYNFVRFGFNGYRSISLKTRDVALYLAKEIEKTGYFEIYNDGSVMPLVTYKLKEDANVSWNLYDIQDRMLMKGWQLPAYPLPKDLEEVIIQRIVVRGDLGVNMAEAFIQDFNAAIDQLENKTNSMASDNKTSGFTH